MWALSLGVRSFIKSHPKGGRKSKYLLRKEEGDTYSSILNFIGGKVAKKEGTEGISREERRNPGVGIEDGPPKARPGGEGISCYNVPLLQMRGGKRKVQLGGLSDNEDGGDGGRTPTAFIRWGTSRSRGRWSWFLSFIPLTAIKKDLNQNPTEERKEKSSRLFDCWKKTERICRRQGKEKKGTTDCKSGIMRKMALARQNGKGQKAGKRITVELKGLVSVPSLRPD